ncbi:MAG: NADPH:quinone oxidoreductase family protein [Burkholderiales bacterium]|nr:NADPH:quinone oxidoreductase family protein [Burkholderiales bacterium]
MKAIVCKAWGLPETLVIEEQADLLPAAGEIVIDIMAAGVNFPDVLIIQNKYQFKPELPFTPGNELAGTVHAVGAGVSAYKVGDKVFAFVPQGAFAQQVKVTADAVLPMAAGMDFDTAAAITLTYGTSHHAVVDRAQLKAGETMLVLVAAGGVGLAAIEIGKALGARVIAAASTAEKLAVCKEHGADVLINYTTEDLREAIKAATNGKGPDVVYDPVGGSYTEPAFRSIAWRGRYLVIGFANGEIPKLPLNLPLLKGASLVGVFWGDFARREPAHNLAAMQELMRWLAEGKIKPHISARYALADTPQALIDMASRKVTGKIVILPRQ